MQERHLTSQDQNLDTAELWSNFVRGCTDPSSAVRRTHVSTSSLPSLAVHLDAVSEL